MHLAKTWSQQACICNFITKNARLEVQMGRSCDAELCHFRISSHKIIGGRSATSTKAMHKILGFLCQVKILFLPLRLR